MLNIGILSTLNCLWFVDAIDGREFQERRDWVQFNIIQEMAFVKRRNANAYFGVEVCLCLTFAFKLHSEYLFRKQISLVNSHTLDKDNLKKDMLWNIQHLTWIYVNCSFLSTKKFPIRGNQKHFVNGGSLIIKFKTFKEKVLPFLAALQPHLSTRQFE